MIIFATDEKAWEAYLTIMQTCFQHQYEAHFSIQRSSCVKSFNISADSFRRFNSAIVTSGKNHSAGPLFGNSVAAVM